MPSSRDSPTKANRDHIQQHKVLGESSFIASIKFDKDFYGRACRQLWLRCSLGPPNLPCWGGAAFVGEAGPSTGVKTDRYRRFNRASGSGAREGGAGDVVERERWVVREMGGRDMTHPRVF